MKGSFEQLLERLKRSGFDKEVQTLASSHLTSFVADEGADDGTPPEIPASVGRFEILGDLGEGGYSQVYLGAQQTPVRRVVAIKMLKKGMDSAAVLARFRAEQQALTLMDHPNVAAIFESGTADDGRPWFAMPLVAGLPICAHCDLEQLGIHERLRLFIAACEGVNHAHQRGILHRDLKPANILVNFEQRVAVPKVIDFGIAKAVEGGDPLSSLTTLTASPLGTPAYMSPEHFSGLTDTRSDVWSLGIILGETLCGVRPVRQDASRGDEGRFVPSQPERPSQRLRRLAQQDPAGAAEVAAQRGLKLKSLEARLRGDLDAIVMKCLEADPARRYQSVDALLADLRRHLNHEVIEARPPSLLERARRQFRRQRLQFIATGCVFAILIAAVIVSNRFARQAEDSSVVAQSVTQFLVDTIGAADPFDAQGRAGTSLGEVLDAAVSQFRANPPPRVNEAVAIATVLGGTLTQVGKPETAIEMLDFAMSKAAARDGVESRGYLDAAAKKARALQALGKVDDACALFATVVAASRPAWTPGDASAVATLSDYGLALRDAGRTAEAEATLREALDRSQALTGRDRLVAASAMSDMGVLLQDVGRFREALPLQEAALQIERDLLGEANATVAAEWHNLSITQKSLGQTAQAEANLRKSLETMRSIAGETNPTTALLLNTLAVALLEQGRHAEAEEQFRKSLAAYRTHFPADHPDVARVQNSLALCLREQGRIQESESLYRQALAAQQKSLGADHPEVIVTLNNLARALLDQGKLEPALECSNQCVEKSNRLFAATDPKRWVFLARRGAILSAMRRWSEAEADLAASWAGLSPLEAPAFRKRIVLSELAQLHANWEKAEPGPGRTEAARAWQAKLAQFDAENPAPPK
jgi:tetratricopeptide (TPR) repeat protein